VTEPSTSHHDIIDTNGYQLRGGLAPAPDDHSVVVELAELLPRVTELAVHLNTETCSDQDRARLRELVPAGTFLLLLQDLADLRSARARQESRAVRRAERRTIDLVGFFEDYQEPAEQ
jgi:hypothetical protein